MLYNKNKMSYHFSMGAINKSTDNYEYPKMANKKNNYKCPSCQRDVIFRNGKIKQPHFAHKRTNNPCYYYDKPNETQIHKDAKMLMKSLLDNKKNIYFLRSCKHCRNGDINTIDLFEITEKDYNINSKAVIEYKFNHNDSNRSADVAFIEDDKIKNIFEICYKNKTKEENRPEPWVEINAKNLILNINSGEIIDDEGDITIECIREYKCDECIEYEEERLVISKRWNDWCKREDDIRREKERLERERILERIEKERLEKEWFERETMEKERFERETEEKQKMEYENIRKALSQNIKCDLCKINYCKCDKPNYIRDNYNRIICNSCKKQKCKCLRITDYFNQK